MVVVTHLNNMNTSIFTVLTCLSLSVKPLLAAKSAPESYVDTWSSTAVQQMLAHKIPASITLAQGILESGAGRSLLATEGNNHFGIKCHDWQGERMYKDDDKKNECFRVYPSADMSFEDHSAFLSKRGRYAPLFDLDVEDYKSWARGLKKAGYATNPQYANRLIDIIEKYDLPQYDKVDLLASNVITNGEPQTVAIEKTNRVEVVQISTSHQVLKANDRVKYVVAKEGDTYYRISKEFGLGLWQLYRYNDVSKHKDMLEPGDRVYIQPKANRVKSKNNHRVETQMESLISISQLYGVKLKTLKKRNPTVNEAESLAVGMKVSIK